jgi:catechol 2,3-dioxygenase-like lactoylglutathione lyase family enzyme
MLGSAKAVAFASVTDLDRARAFYEGVLGLKVLSQGAFALMCEAGGVSVRITKVETLTPQSFTVVGFEVEDIGAMVQGLAARGVVFEHYPFFGSAQDAHGIWTAPSGSLVAWFQDPDGNLLSISTTTS